MPIDDPIEQADEDNPAPDTSRGLVATLKIATLLAGLLGGDLNYVAVAGVAGQFVDFAREFMEGHRQEARAAAMVEGLRAAAVSLGEQVADLKNRVAGPAAEEAIVLAIQRVSNTANLEKARRFGRIIGGTLAQESPNWDEATQFIRAIEEFTEQDIVALKVFLRIQRPLYRVFEGPRRMMSPNPNDYTGNWNDVVSHAAAKGFVADDWHAECSRLAGFGVVVPIQSNPAQQSPDAACYRIAGRGMRLLALLGSNTDPGAYPSVRYHKTRPPQTVCDEDEDLALGNGWADSPAAFAD